MSTALIKKSLFKESNVLQFLDEDDKPHAEAWVDGYSFGDRLLEDVLFRATIVNGMVKIDMPKDTPGHRYMTANRISIPRWVKVIQESAQVGTLDSYQTLDGEDLYLSEVEAPPAAAKPLAQEVNKVDLAGIMGKLGKPRE